MKTVRRAATGLLGLLSALVLLVSVVSAATQGFLSSRLEIVDTKGTLSIPSAAPQAFSEPRITPSPTASGLAAEAASQGREEPVIEVLSRGAPLNILVIGSDSREAQGPGFGDPSQFAGERSDTMILVHLNAARDRAAVISLPRDLWVDLPACENRKGETTRPNTGRLNEAFAIGGAPCTIQAVANLTGQPIHHVAVVDFQGFKAIIDGLGGIEICLDTPVQDRNARLKLPAGLQTITGDQALALARARYAIGDGSDLSRIDRQHRIAQAVLSHLTRTGASSDPRAVYRLADSAAQAVTVDAGLADPAYLSSLLATALNMDPTRVEYLTWPWVPRDGVTINIDHTTASTWTAALLADDLPLQKTKRQNSPAPQALASDTSATAAKDAGETQQGTLLPKIPSVCADPLF